MYVYDAVELILYNSIYAWGGFWVTYHVLALALDSVYKTTNKITKSDIYYVLMKNMNYTLLGQIAMFSVMPHGILNPQWMIYRFLISMVLVEVVFFYTHKLLHHPRLYKYHRVHHEFIEPCASSAMYCHPIEAVFSNQLAVTISPVITGMSLLEIMVWTSFCAINTVKSHSGLRMNYFNSKYHDLHHSKRNVNFGFLYLLDILHGTCDLTQELI